MACNEPYFNVYPTRCLLRQPLPQNRLPSNIKPANIPEPPILGQGGQIKTGKGYLPQKGYDPTGYDDLDGLKYEIETEEQLQNNEIARQQSILNTASMESEEEIKEGMNEHSPPFWLNEPSVLFKDIFDAIPRKGMEENALLNSAVRFSIYVFLITFILFRRTEGIYFVLIVMIASVIIKENNNRKKEGYPPFLPSPPDPYGWSWSDYVVGLNRTGPEYFTGMPILAGNPDPYVLPKDWRKRGSKKTGELDIGASLGGTPVVQKKKEKDIVYSHPLTAHPIGQAEPMRDIQHYIYNDPRQYISRKGPELVKKLMSEEQREEKRKEARANGGFIPLTTQEGFTTYDASYYRPVSELAGELIERRNSQDMLQDPFCLAGRGYENIVGDPEKIRRKIYV